MDGSCSKRRSRTCGRSARRSSRPRPVLASPSATCSRATSLRRSPRRRQLLGEIQGKSGYEHIELTTLRVLGTATAFAELGDRTSSDGSSGDPGAPSLPLQHAIERCDRSSVSL